MALEQHALEQIVLEQIVLEQIVLEQMVLRQVSLQTKSRCRREEEKTLFQKFPLKFFLPKKTKS